MKARLQPSGCQLDLRAALWLRGALRRGVGGGGGTGDGGCTIRAFSESGHGELWERCKK